MKKSVCSFYLALSLLSLNLFAQTPPDGSFPVTFKNLSEFPDSQIYIYAIGMTGGKWCHLDSAGIPVPMSSADKDAPGHITKNGKNYPDYNVPLSRAKNFRIPPEVGGGRIYMSMGSPLYITGDATGVQLPDPNNPGDPNDDVYYDWFEYCYQYNVIQFGGNTTQVDIFGFPYVAEVKQDATNFHDSCGISGWSRDKVIQYFKDHLSTPFQQCIRTCRVVAPRSSFQFAKGGAYENYLKPYVDSLWEVWKTNPLIFYNGTQKYVGTVNSSDSLEFSGAETGSMSKPSTQEIWACAGFPGYVGAALSAAFNRGIAGEGANYYKIETYYPGGNKYKNEFSDLLHQISIHNKAYGFAYDDNNNQSSVLIVGSSQPLTYLKITFYPFHESSAATIMPHQSKSKGTTIKLSHENLITLNSSVPIKKIELVSVNGKVVKSASNNNIISTAGLATGTYYLKVTDKMGHESSGITRAVKPNE